MATYEKSFKEEAVRLSDEVGVKRAANQLGIPWNKRRAKDAVHRERTRKIGIGIIRYCSTSRTFPPVIGAEHIRSIGRLIGESPRQGEHGAHVAGETQQPFTPPHRAEGMKGCTEDEESMRNRMQQ